MSSKYTSFTADPKSTSNKTTYKYVSVTGDSHMRETPHKEGVSLTIIKKGSTASEADYANFVIYVKIA